MSLYFPFFIPGEQRPSGCVKKSLDALVRILEREREGNGRNVRGDGDSSRHGLDDAVGVSEDTEEAVVSTVQSRRVEIQGGDACPLKRRRWERGRTLESVSLWFGCVSSC